jgi:hypothetical protein
MTLYILADEKPHFAKDLAAALNMELSNFIADVLTPLISDNFCCYGEPIKTRKRGRPPRPIIILKDNLPFEKAIRDADGASKKRLQAVEEQHNEIFQHILESEKRWAEIQRSERDEEPPK